MPGIASVATPASTPTAPPTIVGNPATRLATRNASSLRIVASVRTPARRERGSFSRQPR